ncbi:hypothetical protein A0H81_04091 [Grifola frondosa]|uniref:Uncharacterized protein n=1 Tax=Grifola frondosa TaxID=5627 RepID=A0A1C7MEC3_GRIFR|nr:hypothetical protein A0H81_04091 [Grifola frondosa]
MTARGTCADSRAVDREVERDQSLHLSGVTSEEGRRAGNAEEGGSWEKCVRGDWVRIQGHIPVRWGLGEQGWDVEFGRADGRTTSIVIDGIRHIITPAPIDFSET